MESLENKTENQSKDITHEFEIMDSIEFMNFLRSQRNEPSLSIITNWNGISHARKLKAFIDEPDANQKRSATIKATQEQHDEELNVFASGVKWEKIEN